MLIQGIHDVRREFIHATALPSELPDIWSVKTVRSTVVTYYHQSVVYFADQWKEADGRSDSTENLETGHGVKRERSLR